jgi:5-methylcytosine-specific restriction endonuclease McrA
LDVSFRPIDVLSWQRAITLSLFDKAEALEYYSAVVRSPSRSFPLPAVLKIGFFLAPSKTSKLSVSRRNVLIRDADVCQYCSKSADSIDHVLPVSRGGAWSWTNLVAACSRCNAKKGASTVRRPA